MNAYTITVWSPRCPSEEEEHTYIADVIESAVAHTATGDAVQVTNRKWDGYITVYHWFDGEIHKPFAEYKGPGNIPETAADLVARLNVLFEA